MNSLPIFSPMFNKSSCQISPPNLAADYFLYGVLKNGKRAPSTGMLYSNRNFIYWAHQQVFLGTDPRIMFIPLTNSTSDYFMPSKRFKILVLCSHWFTCVFSCLPFVTKSANDMKFTDPQVIRAVEVFNEVLVNVVGYIRNLDLAVDSTKMFYSEKPKFASVFRNFLRNESGILCPKLPEHGLIAVLVLLELGEDSGYGNSHPFFLALTSINAWLNFLHQTRQMTGWMRFLMKDPANSIYLRHRTPLVLRRDHEDGIMSCLLCKSREIMAVPENKIHDEIYQIARVYSDGVESISDEDLETLQNDEMVDGSESDPQDLDYGAFDPGLPFAMHIPGRWMQEKMLQKHGARRGL